MLTRSFPLYRSIDEYEIECEKQDVGSVTLSMFKSREADAHEDVKEMNKVYGTKLEVCFLLHSRPSQFC